jgi:O-antigen/teichoic acid export membrane protein
MAIRHDLLLSYGSQIYAAVLSIAFVPVYLRYVGVEAYGLIGFSIMLQGVTQLLDMGLGQTLMREASRTRIHADLQTTTHGLLIAGEKLFLLLGLGIAACLFFGVSWLSTTWLKAEHLSNDTIQTSLLLAAALAGLRWYTNFYRSGLLGYGLLNWVNTLGAGFATLRYIGIVPLLAYAGWGVVELFAFQLLIGLIEAVTYRWKLGNITKPPSSKNIPDSITLLRQHYRMLGALALVSWLWAAMTQLDKVLLSHWLTLADYGQFSLAITAAGVIALLSAPIGQMLQPRLNALAAANDHEALFKLYRIANQRLTLLVVGAASLLAFFAEPILYLWTGDALHAQQAAPILFWYALGNASAALLMLPFMLQYAVGNLRLHLIGNLIFAVLWLPAIVWASYTAGGVGAGIAWFTGNTLFLLGWTSFTHLRLFPELPKTWLLQNVAGIAAPTFAAAYAIFILLSPYTALIRPSIP